LPDFVPDRSVNQGIVDSRSDAPGNLERWIIKSEQFVNVALTVRAFLLYIAFSFLN